MTREAIDIADGADSIRSAATLLRQRYAPMRVVVVDAFDMRHEVPAAVGQRCALYMAASDGHCWQVTQSPEQAIGYFLADRA